MIRTDAIIRINKLANKGKGQLVLTVPRRSGFKPGDRVMIYPAKVVLLRD